jgi:predicted RNA-binding protein (virulence factor B family)
MHDMVTHDRYGLGTVVGVEEEVAVLVDFGTQRERITAPYSKLTKL